MEKDKKTAAEHIAQQHRGLDKAEHRVCVLY